MSVNISKLGLGNPQISRLIRERINTPNGAINVFEPSVQDLETILEIQRKNGFDMQTDLVEFNEETMVKEIFPLLTDIDFEGMSQEELDAVLANPTVHLMIAQNIISQIIAEANKLFAHRIKADLANADSVLTQVELISSIPSLIEETAKRNPEVAKQVEAIREATLAFAEDMDSEEDGQEPESPDEPELNLETETETETQTNSEPEPEQATEAPENDKTI